MAYTVKQVAAMSGVSVRTLHFYDETGLLKPARVGANGYRFYEEPQLLTLQQILFYRELGFGLRQIQEILGRCDFERVAALRSHRAVLEKSAVRTRSLIETIDRTIEHLEGTKLMNTDEIFAGFHVAAGDDRFGERVTLGGDPSDCKVSARDTNGTLCIFEFAGGGGGPRHRHRDQDEWIYVLAGEIELLLDGKPLRLGAGESAFVPRKAAHVWGCVPGEPVKILNVYQPAGKMEAFFRAVGQATDLPSREQVLERTYSEGQVHAVRQLFEAHDMDLLGPPHIVE